MFQNIKTPATGSYFTIVKFGRDVCVWIEPYKQVRVSVSDCVDYDCSFILFDVIFTDVSQGSANMT